MILFGDCRRFEPNGHDWKVVEHLVDGFIGWNCAFCGETVVVGEDGWLFWLFAIDEAD